MKIQIFIKLTVVLWLFVSISAALCAENSKDFEGWSWHPTFEVRAPHFKSPMTAPAMDDAHHQMQEMMYSEKDKAIRGHLGLDKTPKKEDGKNAILLRLGVVVRSQNGPDTQYAYQPTNCFKSLIGFSGSDTPDRTNTLDLKKFSSNYLQIDPVGYNFIPQNILQELRARFPVVGVQKPPVHPSALSQPVYERCTYKELAQPSCLTVSLDRSSSDGFHTTTAQSLERFKLQITRLHDRHAHSEPRALYYLTKGANSIPAYWDFHIELFINDAIARLKEFIAINHQLFHPTNVDATLQDFHAKLLSVPLRADMTEKLEFFQGLHQQERQKNFEKTKGDALRALKILKVSLDALCEIQAKNPLMLDLTDPLEFRNKAFTILRQLEEVFHRPTYNNMNDFERDDATLEDLTEKLPFQDATKPPIEDWRFEFVQSLRALQPHEKMTDLVFHMHSFFDICEDCAPNLAREWERTDGFLTRIKSWVLAFNGDGTIPDVHLLISCSNIRKVAQDRFVSPTFNNSKMKPIFTQTFIAPPPPPADAAAPKDASAGAVSKAVKAAPKSVAAPTALPTAASSSTPKGDTATASAASPVGSGSSVVSKEDKEKK